MQYVGILLRELSTEGFDVELSALQRGEVHNRQQRLEYHELVCGLIDSFYEHLANSLLVFVEYELRIAFLEKCRKETVPQLPFLTLGTV